jgi:hypothetical protein
MIAIVAIGIIGLFTAARAVRVVQQYERGVVFRFGRVQEGSRGPGLTLIVPGVDRLVKVADPAALQLRLLQTVVEVAAKNSTLVMPFPVELLRFLDRVTPAASTRAPAVAPRPRAPETVTMLDVRRVISEPGPETTPMPVS